MYATPRVLEEEERGHQRDDDAGADRRAGRSVTLLSGFESRQLAVARHRVGEPDRRRLDRQAADEDRERDDQQVAGGERLGEVGLDDLRRRDAARLRPPCRATPGIAISIAHRNTKPITNAAAIEPSTARGAARRGSLRLLGQRRRGVEAVDHEQAHEHRDEEVRGVERRAAGVEDDADALVVVEQREDDREHEQAEQLEQHAGVVDQRHDAHAEDVQQRDHDERDGRDPLLVGEAVAASMSLMPMSLMHRDQRQRQRRDDGGDGQRARPQVDPAREPRVRLRAAEELRPLEHRAGDREVRGDLGEVQRDDELAERDDRQRPDERAARACRRRG